MTHEHDYEQLDKAWSALDEGDPQRALELTKPVDEGLGETWILRATAALDLDDLDAAEVAAERAAELEDEQEDPELLCVRAELALRHWRIDEAREKLERARTLAPNAALLLKLALVADVEGDLGRADRLQREAQKLDPANVNPPPRLSESDFDAALQAAIARLPAPFQTALEQVAVIVDPMPNLSILGDDPSATPPDLLGLFTGASRLERVDEGAAELPPTIHLFQRNLERVCEDRAEVEEQLEVTLLHELGHYLGFDEDGVAELGLE
jgi:predicted Zn-dependent protease with MMP-like domain